MKTSETEATGQYAAGPACCWREIVQNGGETLQSAGLTLEHLIDHPRAPRRAGEGAR